MPTGTLSHVWLGMWNQLHSAWLTRLPMRHNACRLLVSIAHSNMDAFLSCTEFVWCLPFVVCIRDCPMTSRQMKLTVHYRMSCRCPSACLHACKLLTCVPGNADIQTRHPRHWQDFSHAVTNEEHWAALWPALEAINRAAAPGVHTNSAIQVDAALIQ